MVTISQILDKLELNLISTVEKYERNDFIL